MIDDCYIQSRGYLLVHRLSLNQMVRPRSWSTPQHSYTPFTTARRTKADNYDARYSKSDTSLAALAKLRDNYQDEVVLKRLSVLDILQQHTVPS